MTERDLRVAVLEEAIEIVQQAANGYGALAAASARTAIRKLRERQAELVAEAATA